LADDRRVGRFINQPSGRAILFGNIKRDTAPSPRKEFV
jgi:hypothetical protein